ncbi:MAG: hypothetical protein ACR2OU_07860, partial [Thermomicrobiales bacterium]
LPRIDLSLDLAQFSVISILEMFLPSLTQYNESGRRDVSHHGNTIAENVRSMERELRMQDSTTRN